MTMPFSHHASDRKHAAPGHAHGYAHGYAKENCMSRTKFIALALLASCVQDPLIPEFNAPPVAVARVISAKGESIDEMTDEAGLVFAFSGSPVTITLDGSGSSDPNGMIKQYRWLSGTLTPDAGAAQPAKRLVPAGAAADWPADEQQPQVQLGEGVWTFTLWVVDDQGSVSDPDTIRITVGSSAAAATECVATVLPSVAMGCKQCVCEQSDTCRQAADQSMCGQDCWGLVFCIRDMCPTRETACITGNCSAFLANGRAGATPIGPCVIACTDACAAGK
jgi:hypothetical protein